MPVVLLEIYKPDADTAAIVTEILQIKDDALEVEHAGSTHDDRHLGMPKSGDAAQEPDAGMSTGMRVGTAATIELRPTDADRGSAREGAEALAAASAERSGSVGL